MIADGPLIPFELLSMGLARPLETADEIVAHGWQKRGLTRVRLEGPFPWTATTPRSFAFSLHSLGLIDAPLQAYSQSGRDAYLDAAVTAAKDWILRHPRTPETVEKAPFAWYDMAVGLRAYRLGYLYDAASRSGRLDPQETALWWQSLKDHADFLADDSKIAFHSNHGYYQIAGQMALGRRFAHAGPPFTDALAQGEERMHRMLHSQFAADGIHLEHSPDYHRMVYLTLIGLLRAGLIRNPEISNFANRIEHALAWFVRPNVTITNFGDCDARPMWRKPADAIHAWTTDEMRYAVSSGAVGLPQSTPARLFPDGGYGVVRQPHPDLPPAQDSYLAMAAAFHSRTHKHADDLNFVWDEFGAPILIDAGRFGYVDKVETGSPLWQQGFWYGHPSRVYVEGTRAHNCLEFDAQNYPRRGVKPYGSGMEMLVEADGVFALRGEVRQFKTIRHARTLILAPRQWLVVLDGWSDAGNAPHEVRQWFQLATDHSATAEAEGYRVALGQDGAPPLIVRPLLGDPEMLAPIRGQDAPLQGWWSPHERAFEPATSLCLRAPDSAGGVMATLFAFGETVTAGVSRANTLARSATLRFATDAVAWRIEFSAEHAEAPLTVVRGRPSV